MGLWSKIKYAAQCAWQGVKRFFSKIGNVIGSALATVSTAVAAIAPNPIVKTIATAVAVAVPVITVGANVVKAINDKKDSDPETTVEKMLTSYDEDEDYYADEAGEFVQREVDGRIYGKKSAKNMAKQRAAEKTDEVKRNSKSSKSTETNEFVNDDSDMNVDDIVDKMADDEEDDESYPDESPAVNIGNTMNVSKTLAEKCFGKTKVNTNCNSIAFGSC